MILAKWLRHFNNLSSGEDRGSRKLFLRKNAKGARIPPLLSY
jgi:hypothetical protein